MNKGDRLVCINTEICKEDSVLLRGLYLELNRIYFYEDRTIGDYAISMSISKPFERYALFTIGTLEKYFMPYNEWLALEREKQIKMLLDE